MGRTISAILFFTFCASCDTPQNMLRAGGPVSHQIATLTSWILITFCVVTLVMWGLLAMVATRRRGSLTEHEPIDVGGGQNWILTGGFLIPFVILAVIFIAGLRAMNAFPVHDGGHVHPQIRVTGHQWWWELDYLNDSPINQFKSANEIHIPVGKPIDIELQSIDVIHSFWIPRLHGKVDLIPGQPNVIRIQADQPGEYRGQCGEYCGAQHAHMMLLVIAQPEAEYQAWAVGQLNNSLQPVNDEQTSGQQLFMTRACVLCHTIRGTDAHGAVGPDLTHFATRIGLASNMLPNNDANLRGWVTHAQSLKPGAQMPNVTQFTGRELDALAQYLQSLK